MFTLDRGISAFAKICDLYEIIITHNLQIISGTSCTHDGRHGTGWKPEQVQDIGHNRFRLTNRTHFDLLLLVVSRRREDSGRIKVGDVSERGSRVSADKPEVISPFCI
jgi:hypothetical protein